MSRQCGKPNAKDPAGPAVYGASQGPRGRHHSQQHLPHQGSSRNVRAGPGGLEMAGRWVFGATGMYIVSPVW